MALDQLSAKVHQVSRESGSSLEVPDVAGLRRLLNRCERHGAQVLGVDTRNSGLEELFLKVSGAADHSEGKAGR